MAAYPARASDIYKADNTLALANGESWQDGEVPGASDVAVWDFDSLPTTLASSVSFGGDLSLSGIRSIGTSDENGYTLSGTGYQLEIGEAGIDLSGAGDWSYLIINPTTLKLASNTWQTWSVAISRDVYLEVRGTLSREASTAINFDMLGEEAGEGGGLYFPAAGSAGTLIGNWAFYEEDDFAGLNSASEVISGMSLGVYSSNPAPDETTVLPASGTPGGIMDFVTTTTSDGSLPLQGINANGGWYLGGFRFNLPLARTEEEQAADAVAGEVTPKNWTVNIATNRTITASSGILVGSGVGVDNVELTGNGWFRIDNTNSLALHQNNPLGDLIFNNAGGIAVRSSSAHIRKTGPGRVIVNCWVGANGGLYLLDGTVQFGSGGTVGAPGSGPIVNKGTLVINRSDAVSVPGVISGDGLIRKQGTGTLTLSGENTYSGDLLVEGGNIRIGHVSALGEGGAITLTDAGLIYGDGINTDISSHVVTFASGNITIDTNGNDVTWADSIGDGGEGALVKIGAGSLTLASANDYSGGTTVTGGFLNVANTSGSATGSGPVTFATGSGLRGSGIIAGAVTLQTGATLFSSGQLVVGSLDPSANLAWTVEFASSSSYGNVQVTNADGLTLNGLKISLYETGATTPWVTSGVYTLFRYSGSLQGSGVSGLSVANPQPGYGYAFATDGTSITLTITQEAIISEWSAGDGGSWGASGNWTNGVPVSGYTALFTGDLSAPVTVTLDGDRTVNGMAFSGTGDNGYTIASGSGGSLTLDKGSSVLPVNVSLGSHYIEVPVVLASSLAVTVDEGASLTISGDVSGSGGVTKMGEGLLVLAGINTFTGDITIEGGILEFASEASLGAGGVYFNGGILRYAEGNTDDISGRILSFALDGATIDTNGNDVILANAIGNEGTGFFIKDGAGALVLGAANTYKGYTGILGGTLVISSNENLGDPVTGAGLLLDGGELYSTATLALEYVDEAEEVHARPVTLDGDGGTFDVADATTLTVRGALTGAGSLTKMGSGVMAIDSATSTFDGGTLLKEGSLQLSSGRVLGTGPITFDGGTLITLGSTLANPLVVETSGTLIAGRPGSGGTTYYDNFNGTLTGSGILTWRSASVRATIGGNWSGFTGRINLDTSGSIKELRIGSYSGLGGAVVDLGEDGYFYITVNQTSGSVGSSFAIGTLHGGASASLRGGPINGRITTFNIGARNEDSVFEGNIGEIYNTSYNGYSITKLVKVGSGTFALTGANTWQGTTTVSAGTLRIDGSLIPMNGDVEVTGGDVTVAEDGVIGGTGRIVPAVSVLGGTLRPDPDGIAGGQLVVEGVLTLASTETRSPETRFDFGGAIFTGIKTTAADGLVYAGNLDLNFLGAVYTGSYQLFEHAGATGSFAAVTVTGLSDEPVALADSGSGVWTGSVGVVSFTFTQSTGVLEIAGGDTPSIPTVPVGLAAVAGDAWVQLAWDAVSDATRYIVKRSTTDGSDYVVISNNVATTSFTDTGLTNGTTYYYVVAAANDSGVSADSSQVSATPTETVTWTALENWRQEYFATTENSGDAADDADPNGNGIPNLLEYALGRNPTAASTEPAITIGKTEDGQYLTLTFNRIVDSDLTYTVEATNELVDATWSEVVDASTVTVEADAGSWTVTDTVPISANPRRFLRLTVSY